MVPKDTMELMELVIGEILVTGHKISYRQGISSKDALIYRMLIIVNGNIRNP